VILQICPVQESQVGKFLNRVRVRLSILQKFIPKPEYFKCGSVFGVAPGADTLKIGRDHKVASHMRGFPGKQFLLPARFLSDCPGYD
jgi:hypothetical protein